jgi:GAF domain-containing protein
MSISFYTMADKPENERQREHAIARSKIVDNLNAWQLRPILIEMRQILDAKSAAVTIVYQDSTYVLAAVGFEPGIYKRSTSFCAHAILTPDELTIVPDAGADERFAGNPFVDTIQGIQFYIGAPLRDENGTVLGALCAFGEKPRHIVTDEDKARVIALRRQAEAIVHGMSKQRNGAGGQAAQPAALRR